MKVVVDASVVVKWLFPDPEDEPESVRALAVLRGIRNGELEVSQPPHWLAEVAAVLARLAPDAAHDALDLLDAMELPVIDELTAYKHASTLAAELRHHLFDTLYHAVALQTGGTLVSADDRYCRRARRLGGLVRLAEWKVGMAEPP